MSGSTVIDYEKHQVFDTPLIDLQVTEHRGEIKNCPHCHIVNRAVFPEAISQSVQCGINVQQLAVYFTQYQLLPYGRASEIFKDLFGHALSSSFLVNNNHRYAVKLKSFITELKTTLLTQPVLHCDETGFYFDSQQNWLHTMCTNKHTLYAPHIKCGTEAMQNMGVLPFYQGRLIHDFWKPYQEFACDHSLCWWNLWKRHINYLLEIGNGSLYLIGWPIDAWIVREVEEQGLHTADNKTAAGRARNRRVELSTSY